MLLIVVVVMHGCLLMFGKLLKQLLMFVKLLKHCLTAFFVMIVTVS
jgi:hypothetical protein